MHTDKWPIPGKIFYDHATSISFIDGEKTEVGLLKGPVGGIWLSFDISNDNVRAVSFHSSRPASFKDDYLIRLEIGEDDKFRLIMLPGRPLGDHDQQNQNILWRSHCQDIITGYLAKLKL